MDINKMKSNLKMEEFYFSECSIKRNSSVSSGKYQADLKKKIEKAEEEHTYTVELCLEIKKADVNILIVARAKFVYEADSYNKEESIIDMNTVAIMFPFIRSQVSLLTTQPSMVPIILPPINTSKFKQ